MTTTLGLGAGLLLLRPPLLLDAALISFIMSSSAAFRPIAITEARSAVLNIFAFLFITDANQPFLKYMIDLTIFS